MAKFSLTCNKRSETGSAACRRLRRQGVVPGVVYGHGQEPVPVSVEGREFAKVQHEMGGHASLVTLRLTGDKKDQEMPVIIKDVQVDPVTLGTLNIDFQRVLAGEKITVPVPVVLLGQAPGVPEGGILEHLARELEVECLPGNLPDRIEVDISSLGMGDSIAVRDVALPEGVKATSPAGEVVVMVAVPRMVKEEEAPAPVVEAAEPEVIARGKKEEEEEG